MTFYSFLETSVIFTIGVFSIYQVMKLLMPQLTRRVRGLIALQLSRPGNRWRNALATRLRDAAPSGGCAAGCGGGCNACGIAGRVHPPLTGDDKSSG